MTSRYPTVAIMQPYFLPYIGYWQLMSHVDAFVVYDNVQFTREGWIHRNRYLASGTIKTFTLPVRREGRFLDIRERRLATGFAASNERVLGRLANAYRGVQRYSEILPLLESVLRFRDDSLLRFLINAMEHVREELGITTPLLYASELEGDRTLRGQERVIALCRALGARTYVNAIGGRALYSHDAFAAHGIGLRFIESITEPYPQPHNTFMADLSVVDALMCTSREWVMHQLSSFRLIR